jgi:hypothetical protein
MSKRSIVQLFALILAATIAGCGGGSNDAGALKSTNWSGYQITGAPLGFHHVAAQWDVPEVTRTGSLDTNSSTWTGVGGGSVAADFLVDDPTLIQAGTEQDITGGKPTYFAWWEAIPGPPFEASGGPLSNQTFPVSPGDTIRVDIDVTQLAVWNISIHNDDRGWTFKTTVPYVAAGLTAEWIEEEPGVHASAISQTSLANFDTVDFSDLKANGVNPHLNRGEKILMVDSSGQHVKARPSDPDGGDSFTICHGSDSCD